MVHFSKNPSTNGPSMSYDDSNIFAKILRGELPCIRVYEDDSVLSFMDIMPQAEGHTLVVPKHPAETLFDLPDDAAASCIIKVKEIASAVKQGLHAKGITLFQLNGSAAGQTVPHIHFHILPASIQQAREHATHNADSEHLQALADKIKQYL